MTNGMAEEQEMLIRGYRSGDLERLQAITIEAFEAVSIDKNLEAEFGELGDRDWKWRKARAILDDCERDPQGVFVAEVGSDVVGYITTWIDREAGFGMIPNLAVDSQARGRGIGRQLIQHAIEHFRTSGIAYARIETLEQNAIGQKLYPSLGFREVARQIHYAMRIDP
jgi:ribosomal protein S18 acetylase RimI-like enzyme